MRGRPRIRAVVRATQLSDGIRGFRELSHGIPQFIGDLFALFHRNPGRHLDLEPQGAFIKVRQELTADRCPEEDHSHQSAQTGSVSKEGAINEMPKPVAVTTMQPFERAIAPDMTGFLKCQKAQRRDQGQCAEQRPQECETDRISHGPEQLPFASFESKERAVCQNNHESG